jgi:magnesium transporter
MHFQNLQTQILFPELQAALEHHDEEALLAIIDDLTAEDLAELCGELSSELQAIFLESLPAERAVESFPYLDLPVQKELLSSLSNARVTAIVNEMNADDRTALLESMPQEVTRQLLSFLTPKERALAQKLLDFPEDSVGRLMTPDFLAVKQDWNVQRCLDYIRRHGEDKETLNDIYVVDDRGHLVDDLPIREFLLADPGEPVRELMHQGYVALHADDPEEEAIAAFRKYSKLTAIPVIDDQGFLLGIVTIDDILFLEEQEVTEDIQKMGGAAALEEPYLDASLWDMVRKRAPALIVLFVGEMLTASAMSYFEGAISHAIVLALFIPLIISSGGNAGSQAASLVIRAIALDEVGFHHFWKVFRKELVIGGLIGLILAIVGYLRIGVTAKLFNMYGEHWSALGLTVFLSLLGIVAWGTLVGSLMPILLKRMKLDPATSSTPFVATFVDVTGIVLYFSIAMLILRGKLL